MSFVTHARWRRGVAVLVVAAAALAASLLPGNATSSVSRHNADPAAAGLARARAAVKAFQKSDPNHWEGPTKAVTPKKNLHIAVVECGAQFEGCVGVANAMVEAGKHLGWKVTEYDGKASATTENAAILQAVVQKVDVIVIDAIDPHAVQQGLAAAKNAHIRVISNNQALSSPNPAVARAPLWPEFDVMANMTKMGEAAGDWIVADSGGKAVTQFFVDKEFQSNIEIIQGMQIALKKNCPKCVAPAPISFTAAASATQLGPETVAVLRRNPKINYIGVSADPFSSYQVPQIDQAGMKNRVKLTSVSGYLNAQAYIRAGNVQLSTGAFDLAYVGWATIDQIARITSGQPSIQPYDEHTPVALLVKGNLPPKNSNWSTPAFKWRPYFLKLWGVK